MLMVSSSMWGSFFNVVDSGLRVKLTELWIKTARLLLGLGVDTVVLGCSYGILGLLDWALSLDSLMAATLTLCDSRNMLSSVCLFLILLVFH